MSSAPPSLPQTLTLDWLRRLRWFGIAGQALGFALAALVMKVALPWTPLLLVLGLTVATNLWLLWRPSASISLPPALLAGVMGFDVAALTVILYWTGGPHNPFTTFYLVHVALAAMALTSRWLWTLVGASAAGYALLFVTYRPLFVDGSPVEVACPSYSWHLHGMAIAFVITAAFVAAFVARLHKALQDRDIALAEARLRAARSEQFAALATLSAGVAHELGSPLGTIAVASRELVRNLENSGREPSALEDSRLIRAEVDRCRAILERLSDQATGGVGDAPEAVAAARLFAELKSGLGPGQRDRVALSDETGGALLLLPRAPVVQALGILVKNSCDADLSGREVDLRVRTRGATVEFAVGDHGPGLDPVAAVHAGEPFFTTKEPGAGMGLGLFLVRTLAARLGGELTLENLPRGGLRATLRLPLSTLS